MPKQKQNLIQCFFYMTSISFGVFLALFVSASAQPVMANSLLRAENAIVAETNLLRSEVGLPALRIDSRLTASAYAKAQDMASRSYFGHASPEGWRMAHWINGEGYYYSLGGENIAKGFDSLTRLMNAWKVSPLHYKNLVEPKFEDIGVGIAQGTYEGRPMLFIVQHFGESYIAQSELSGGYEELEQNIVEMVQPYFVSPRVAYASPLETLEKPVVVGTKADGPKVDDVELATISTDGLDSSDNDNTILIVLLLIVLATMGYMDGFEYRKENKKSSDSLV